MTPELEALARRAVACKNWRWMPGMLHRNWRNATRITEEHAGYSRPNCSPDLSDPASLGCLLALVREALGCPEAHVYYADLSRRWVVRWGYEGLGVRTVDGATEASALVAALEAAP